MISREVIRATIDAPPEKLAELIVSELPGLMCRIVDLRSAIYEGSLFVVPAGPEHDRQLLSACLMALAVDAVDVHNPWRRRREMEVIESAARELRVARADVLSLTPKANRIAQVLFAQAE